MAGFNIYDSEPYPSGSIDRESGALDHLIRAAGGAPLPGVFGLAQALSVTWTQTMSGPAPLQHARRALLSAGAIRDYWRSRDPSRLEQKDSPVMKVVKARDLEEVNDVGVLAGLVRSVLSFPGMPAPVMEEVPDTHLVVMSYECGWVEVRSHPDRCTDDRPWGTYCRRGQLSRVIETVRELLWSQKGDCIDLVAITSRHSSTFDLVSPNLNDDFVDSEAGGGALQMAALADRCKRFTAGGFRRGVLLYGPPGTGKSTLARRLAVSASNGRVLRMDPVAVTRASYSGLNAIVTLLDPAVVVLDDMDRAEGATGLLSYLETAKIPIVVGTVNAVGRVDPALLRPGRFDEVHEVKEPGPEWRSRIAEHYIKAFGCDLAAGVVAAASEGFSPADIRELVLVCATVGPDLLSTEAERIRQQRGLYAGGQVDRYLTTMVKG